MSVSKIYRIFLKGECVLEDKREEVFRENWRTLNNLVGLVKTDYVSEDLSYVVETLQKGEDNSKMSDNTIN